MAKAKKSLAAKLKEDNLAKSKNSSKKFLTTRVWIKYFRSLVDKSVYSIPKDIGNNAIVENNVIITKEGITSLIIITEYSADTPITLYEELSQVLGQADIDAKLDIFKRNRYYDPEMETSGLKARERLWKKVITDDESTDHDKETSLLLLETVNALKTGAKLLEASICLKVTGKDGHALQSALTALGGKLKQFGISYIPSNSIKEHLEYYSIGIMKPIGKKDQIQHIIVSTEITSQFAPNLGCINDLRGLNLGTNMINNTPYILDLELITLARNFLVIAGSGVGKTFMVTSAIAALAETLSRRMEYMRIRVDDIKGSEFTALIEGLGGLVLKLTSTSTEYINPFKLIGEEGQSALEIFTSAIQVGTKFILVLSNLEERDESLANPMVSTFLKSFYTQKNIHEDNKKTFISAINVTPFEIFKAFEVYVSAELDRRYNGIPNRMLTSLRPYLGSGGSKNYLFKEEFDMASIYRRKAISCSYGLQDGSNAESFDQTIINFKFFTGKLIKTKYQAYNTYVLKVETGVVLEETQYANKNIRADYKKEITMGRSMKQTNFILTNSVSAMLGDEDLAPIMENIKGFLIGAQESKEARRKIVAYYGIEEYEDLLSMLSTSRFENCFLFINRMRGVSTIIKAKGNPNDKIYLGQR